LDFVLRQAHHRARGFAAAHGVGPRRRIAERFERVIAIPFQAVLFQNVNTDNGIAGGRRIHGEDFAFEAGIVVDPRRDDQFLIDALAAAEEDDEIVFLRILALALGPGDHVVGVVEDKVVRAADQIA